MAELFPTLPGNSAGRGQTVCFPCLALNAGLGGDWQQDGKERGNVTLTLPKDWLEL